MISVLRGAEGWLARRGVEAPKRSAELLLGKVLGRDRLQLYLEHDRPLDEGERAAMRALLQRRGDGEPVAHLLGSWEFRGLEFEVGPAVLIPRPETEELVDVAFELVPAGATAIDLGTGSGAIAVAMCVERPELRMHAVDTSGSAIEVARRNAAAHGVASRITFLHGSWWQPVAGEAAFDLVVSNPPYIDPDAPAGLADDVRRFEPPLALFSAVGDPASCYREICRGLDRHLRPGGWFVAETGEGAADAARAALLSAGLVDVDLRDDLAGRPRFVVGRRPVGGCAQTRLPRST
ncbi:MAG TPA: peptide chain release factor N(5)-glutamine methyltransferase [bacterium]|nr:peptide chain release factor N(5)-glutamine methyltransferase [bacterium]